MLIHLRPPTTRLAALLAITFIGCESPATGPAETPQEVQFNNVGNRVVHFASVGGADVCTALGGHPGCDANFALVARQHADGSVKGQWTDTFGGYTGPATPIQVTLDCLYVSGNEAWVSGVTTGGVFTGLPAISKVVDNGTSANDPPDQISFIEVDVFGGCTAAPDLTLFDMTEGQVIVR